MERTAYQAESVAEESHWWFVGRRKLFSRVVSRLGLEKTKPVLDVGCSTGTNLRMLSELGFRNVVGLELSEQAIELCRSKGFDMVRQGDVRSMPFGGDSFALVLASDIVEHVDDDIAALREIRRVLQPGASVLLTVPAFPSLWGFQDEVSHHRRRYRMGNLVEKVRASGLQVSDAFHFNYLLFAPIWGARQVMRIIKPRIRSEGDINSPFLNRILGHVFDFDTITAERVRPNFGVSILVLARKPISGS